MVAMVRLAAVLALVLFAAGCAAVRTVTVPPEEAPGELPGFVAHFAERTRAVTTTVTGGAGAPATAGDAAANPDPAANPVRLVAEHGSLASAWGCTIGYEYYVRESGPVASEYALAAPLVVLGHGFMRDLATVRGWAVEWAARGVRTVVVDFCNSTLFNGRHDRNARDMIAVANHIEPGDAPLIYAGFSAGGLSALLAAAEDPRTVAYLGLDPVDSGELSKSAGRLNAAALYLYGEPARCNAQNNMIDLMPRANRLVAMSIPFATHCDFEDPSDAFCARLCGTVEPEEKAQEIRRTVRALANAWIEAYAGVSPESQFVFHMPTLETLARARRVVIVASE